MMSLQVDINDREAGLQQVESGIVKLEDGGAIEMIWIVISELKKILFS
jgi:hypothetical protein